MKTHFGNSHQFFQETTSVNVDLFVEFFILRVNISLQKFFSLFERISLDLKLEVKNLFSIQEDIHIDSNIFLTLGIVEMEFDFFETVFVDLTFVNF
jgi:hypothetical protein